MYRKYMKRLLDIIASLLAIIISIPLFFIIVIMIRVRLGKPVLFKQPRVSKYNKVFKLYKFRTMTDERDCDGRILPDVLRFTKLGLFLRNTSLDELPELFNILKGDISFIGPRPLPEEYLILYSEQELHRHIVRAGLIPPEILFDDMKPTWEKQFEYEVYYANNVAFLLDLKIAKKTISMLIKRKTKNYGSYIRNSLPEEREANPKNPN